MRSMPEAAFRLAQAAGHADWCDTVASASEVAATALEDAAHASANAGASSSRSEPAASDNVANPGPLTRLACDLFQIARRPDLRRDTDGVVFQGQWRLGRVSPFKRNEKATAWCIACSVHGASCKFIAPPAKVNQETVVERATWWFSVAQQVGSKDEHLRALHSCVLLPGKP